MISKEQATQIQNVLQHILRRMENLEDQTNTINKKFRTLSDQIDQERRDRLLLSLEGGSFYQKQVSNNFNATPKNDESVLAMSEELNNKINELKSEIASIKEAAITANKKAETANVNNIKKDLHSNNNGIVREPAKSYINNKEESNINNNKKDLHSNNNAIVREPAKSNINNKEESNINNTKKDLHSNNNVIVREQARSQIPIINNTAKNEKEQNLSQQTNLNSSHKIIQNAITQKQRIIHDISIDADSDDIQFSD